MPTFFRLALHVLHARETPWLTIIKSWFRQQFPRVVGQNTPDFQMRRDLKTDFAKRLCVEEGRACVAWRSEITAAY
jgi:hypothetical protein